MRLTLIAVCCLFAAGLARAQSVEDLGADLQNFEYPHPVQLFELETLRGPVPMAYMDVAPEGQGNGETVLLLHGKNFCAAYWEATITTLVDAGYRVVAPDQVGFCKSGKPAAYGYSFHQLAANTVTLLDELEVEQVTVLGHSMGGMLATRFALMFPGRTDRLMLVNPIGLEDWKAEGVPYRGVDAWYRREAGKDFTAIRRYQQNYYYDGEWTEEYERWARMLAGMYVGDDVSRVAWAQALTYDMVYTQPVVHEFGNIQMPTTLFIGQRDRTALGKDLVDDQLADRLGDYPALGRAARDAIPDAELVTFDDIGHLPHVEAPARFHDALLEALNVSATE
ncbi:MAG: alpha/beta hydrolase [Salinisphaeraceae bacterium]